MKSVIIVGGGHSVKEGIEKGLWQHIKDKEVWSCNSVYKVMPYLPKKQFWVDIEFFNHEVGNLQRLHDLGVELVTKEHHKFVPLKDILTQYATSRELDKYYGKLSIEKNHIFYGQMGLCGMFALTYAIAKEYDNIYLLGYDFGSPSLQHMQTHFYQDSLADKNIVSSGAGRPSVYILPEGKLRTEMADFEVYTRETDIKIWNVSLISNIPYFPKISYEEMFNQIGVL